jgi:hypothetical protein
MLFLAVLALDPTRAIPEIPTYARDVAFVLNRSCVPCHRAGESGPFPLTTYAEAKKWSSMISLTTKRRSMPPWSAVPGHGTFQGARVLSPTEIRLLENWDKTGAKPGDLAKAPAAPSFTTGWQLGEPDMVLSMPEPVDITAEGPDQLRNIVIPSALLEDKTVGAMEFRPGNAKVVHHALVFLDNSGVARRLDAADPGVGYVSFGGPGFFPSGSLGGWAPGGTTKWLPDGVGRYFQKGSDVVLQVHYHPSGKPERDQSKIGIFFSRKPVTRLVGGISVENWQISIPAGDANYLRTSNYTLPRDTTVLSVTPHMHLLGKEMRARAILPDGTRRPLVWVKPWSFRWQETYVYQPALKLPAGTRIEMESWHDNSAKNPNNPFSPQRSVTYGEGSNDEMSLCIFEFTTDRFEDLLFTINDNGVHNRVMDRIRSITKPKD